MPSFYIVPPRKTQLGEFGISISGIAGIKTNLLNNAPITSVGALQLDQNFSPTWTAPHVFNDSVTFNSNVFFNGGQSFTIDSLYVAGQTTGDLIYFNGSIWTRFGKSPSNGAVLISTNTSLGWTNNLSLSTTTTNVLKVGNLNGVLRAASGLVLGSSSIGHLNDVQVTSPAGNQILKYNSTLSKWENSNSIVPDRTLVIRFLNGATPFETGPDQEIALVPFEPSDGVSVLIFTVMRIVFQVEAPASLGDSIIRIQRVNANTAFPDPSDPLAQFVAQLILPAGDTEVFIDRTDPLFDELITSGQKLRIIVDSIGSGAEHWTIQLEATAGSLYQQPVGIVPISMGGTGRSTIGNSNTILAVSNSGDKLVYKELVAGTSISIVTTPILISGIEVGGTITISSSAGSGGGSGTSAINIGTPKQLAYYSNSGAVSSAAGIVFSDVVNDNLLTLTSQSSSSTALKIFGATNQNAPLLSVSTATPNIVFEIGSTGIITKGTWQGSKIPIGYGGTGTSVFSNSNGFIYYNGSNLISTNAATSGQLLLSTSFNTVATWTSVNGDVSINGQGTTVIGVAKVQDSMLRDSISNSVLGRSTNSTGTPSDIQATSDGSILRLSGTTLGFGSINLASSNAVTNILPLTNGGTGTSVFANTNGIVFYNGNNLVTSYAATSGQILLSTSFNTVATWTAINGDVTINGQGTTVIGVAKVQNAMLRDSSSNSIIGRSSNSSGTPSDIQASSDGHVLRLSGTTLGFGAIDLASVHAVSGILSLNNGGTGLSTTSPGANFILGVNSSNNGLEYKQLNEGSNISIVHGVNGITISSTGGSGTSAINVGSPKQIAYYSSSGSVSSAAGIVFSDVVTENLLTLTSQSTSSTALKINGSTGQNSPLFVVSTATPSDVFEIGSTGVISVGTWQGSKISIAYGGTGTSTFANTNGFTYYNGANLVSINAATSGQILLSTSFNTVATWTNVNGDVTINGQGTTVIGTAKVQNSMLRNSVSNSLIGRSTNSTGVPADIQAVNENSVLRLSGTTLGFGAINLSTSNAVTGVLSINNGGTASNAFTNTNGLIYYNGSSLITTNTATSGQLLLSTSFNTVATWTAVNGDITINGQGTTIIGVAKVQNSMLRDSAANSIVGRSTNSSGVPADIQATNNNSVLRLSGTTLDFGTVNLASANAVSGVLNINNGGTGTSTFTNTDGIIYFDGGQILSSAYASYSTSNLSLSPYSSNTGGTFELRFKELSANGTNYVALKSADNVSSNYTITIPNTAPNANQYLKSSDINGNTQWSNIKYSKSLSILSPQGTDKITLFHTDTSVSVIKVASVVRGNIPSSSWQLYHGVSRSTGNAVFSSTQTTTSTSTGDILTTFSSSIVSPNSFLWIELSTQTNVDEVHFTVSYE